MPVSGSCRRFREYSSFIAAKRRLNLARFIKPSRWTNESLSINVGSSDIPPSGRSSCRRTHSRSGAALSLNSLRRSRPIASQWPSKRPRKKLRALHANTDMSTLLWRRGQLCRDQLQRLVPGEPDLDISQELIPQESGLLPIEGIEQMAVLPHPVNGVAQLFQFALVGRRVTADQV